MDRVRSQLRVGVLWGAAAISSSATSVPTRSGQPGASSRACFSAGSNGHIMASALTRVSGGAVARLCQCARLQALDSEDKAGASLAERWVREPNESNRRAAFEFANAGGYKSAGAWVAAAAGWSGGSLAPASQETAVPPPDHLTACAVVAAINMLAALDIGKFTMRRAEFITPALNLLNGSGAGAA